LEKIENMKYLIDIGHPAHVHYFKNLANHFISKGDQVLFTCRNKDVVISLLKSYRFNFKNLGKPFKSISGKIAGLIYFNFKFLKLCRSYRPDILLSAGSIYASHTAFIIRRPHITLEDTFNMEQVRLYLPFSSVVLTGCFKHRKLGKKEISYDSFQELAYLHPKYFSPDSSILKELKMPSDQKYYILRFVSWNASHDKGHRGLTTDLKHKLVELLSKHGKVFISSEGPLPKEFEHLQFPLNPKFMHHALAFSDLYIGEGATIASECAMLGTCAIYINSQEAGLIDELENNGLVYHFRSEKGVLEKIEELLEDKNLKKHSSERSMSFVSKKIDFTSFLIWFVENWPESFTIIKKDPEYQNRFR
jgi:uncharacterized protein